MNLRQAQVPKSEVKNIPKGWEIKKLKLKDCEFL